MADADTESKPADEETLVADIDRTRTQLARTIDAISDRVSPKKNVQRAVDQVRERASQAVEQVRERASQIDPLVAGAAVGAAVIGVTVLILWRRRQR